MAILVVVLVMIIIDDDDDYDEDKFRLWKAARSDTADGTWCLDTNGI